MFNDKKQILLVTVGLLMLCALVAQRMILAPHQRQREAVRRQITEAQEFLRIQQHIANRWPLIEQHQLRLPGASSTEWLMREVARLAEQAHIRLTSIDPELAKPVERGATRLTVRVQLDSPYHAVGTFIGLLEGSPQYIHVDGLEMRPMRSLSDIAADTDLAQWPARVQMTLSTLYLPPLSGP